MNNNIDINFDFRFDSNGADPDIASNTLKLYHKSLWSKTLPNGKNFQLEDNLKGCYLYHKSEIGEYFLSSDSIVHTYSKWKRTQHLISQVPKSEIDSFLNLAYTIGGFIIFPANSISGHRTINQERGINKKINDRIDLTLECIRRFYQNEESPLFETLKGYKDFFDLFENFKNYCDYFLLQDLVSDDYSNINFFLPFDDFIYNPLPKDLDEYLEYKKNNMNFLNKRNQRIEDYINNLKYIVF